MNQEQIDLFYSTGKLLRDKGIEKVTEHNDQWMEQCMQALSRHWKYLSEPVTGEDIRKYCEAYGLFPVHSNAWGALINTLVRKKIIVATGAYTQMKDESSHARKTPLYAARQTNN